MAIYKRWYERNPIIAEAMYGWQHSPLSLQRSLARYIKRLYLDNSLRINEKNAGPNRFFAHGQLNSRNATRKRRWYEMDHHVKETIDLLALIEHVDLVNLSEKIIKLNSHIKQREIKAEILPDSELQKLISFVFENASLIRI